MSGNYEIVKTDKEKYVNYKVYVRSSNETWFVVRRYKEFRTMYDRLKKIYPDAGLVIPPKKVFGNFSQKTINERVNGLNNLVSKIIVTPGALSEPCVVEFFNTRSFPGMGEETDDDQQPQSDDTDPNRDRHEGSSFYGTKATPNDFEFKTVIGKGSFGRVYLAKHKESGRHYAVKVLQKSKLRSDREKRHLMSERNVLVNNLEHSFLVSLHFSFQTPAKLFFVLDFVNGGELFYHLQRDRNFTEERAKFYAAEIACALGYLHSRNILYRDMKPENLLLDRMGHVVITDFGLAKDRMDELPGRMTQTFCGTPEYLAPEVLLKQPYSYAVDWWCLGCVLYEMIFGVPPFYHKDHVAMYEAIKKQVVNFNRRNVRLSGAGRDLLSQMLSKDQFKRIGIENDLKDLENHEFFQSLDFEKLEKREIEAPFVPSADGDQDTSNIDEGFLNIPITNSIENAGSTSVLVTENDSRGFVGFTYVRPMDYLD